MVVSSCRQTDMSEFGICVGGGITGLTDGLEVWM